MCFIISKFYTSGILRDCLIRARPRTQVSHSPGQNS
jgi:hypothetical protein